MPKKTQKNRRRGRRPNVFVQSDLPKDDDSRQSEPAYDGEGSHTQSTSASLSAPSAVIANAATASKSASSSRGQRRTRSDVYARTFPREIRKMGILAGGVVVVLTVLTFVL